MLFGSNVVLHGTLYAKDVTRIFSFKLHFYPLRWKLLFIPISQRKKLRLREVKCPFQGHSTSKWQS